MKSLCTACVASTLRNVAFCFSDKPLIFLGVVYKVKSTSPGGSGSALSARTDRDLERRRLRMPRDGLASFATESALDS